MARDAIARQYDVDKNLMGYTCETDKGSYRPGTIAFQPKKGRSLDLRKLREALTATRLSGGTNMGVDYLEITALGTVDAKGETLMVARTMEQFTLKDASTKDGGKTPLQRLREAQAAGATVVSVTGRVEGWSGRFPIVLGALAKRPAGAPTWLVVTGFETSKK